MISKIVRKLRDPEYRKAFVASQINIGIPFQLRAMLKARDWTQEKLAERTGMLQPRISAILKPGKVRLNIETLRRLAEAFDCALLVRFAPFSELVDWSDKFNPDTFVVPAFDEELSNSNLADELTEEREHVGELGYLPSGEMAQITKAVSSIHNASLGKQIDEAAKMLAPAILEMEKIALALGSLSMATAQAGLLRRIAQSSVGNDLAEMGKSLENAARAISAYAKTTLPPDVGFKELAGTNHIESIGAIPLGEPARIYLVVDNTRQQGASGLNLPPAPIKISNALLPPSGTLLPVPA